MKLTVEHIDAQGERVVADLGSAWAVEAASRVLEVPPDDLAVSLHVRHEHGLVFVVGSVRASGGRTCERCGEGVGLAVEAEVDLTYAPAGRDAEAPHELELRADELDVGWFDNGVLDLSDAVSEALALALPARVACQDIPACDARTAALLEPASGTAGHPGFAALKTLIGT